MMSRWTPRALRRPAHLDVAENPPLLLDVDIGHADVAVVFWIVGLAKTCVHGSLRRHRGIVLCCPGRGRLPERRV